MKTIADISQLYHLKGSQQYGGEPISQLDHALQCATLAAAAGQTEEMTIACLLHDLGHLLHNSAENPAESGQDDRHEQLAIPWLHLLFPAAVTEPIRLHVQAKRYLCTVEPSYWDTLSDASKHSLELQGGRFSVAEAKAFIAQPYALDAVRLRRWDDRAKVVGLATPNWQHFVGLLHHLELPGEA
jgi:phosphonate degradation associated HDIG domain protein